jgi:radical SAM protein with 4Fe4S-binding SPASM domain
MERNQDDLEKIYALLIEHGVTVWQLQLATPMGNMAHHREILLGKEQLPAITEFIKEKRRERRINVYAGDDIGYYDSNELYIRGSPGTLATWSGCQAGLSVAGIDSTGNVKGCESLYSDEFIEGNLREAPLKEIWTRPGGFAYNRDFSPEKLEGNCRNCRQGAVCRAGCRSSCFFSTGSLFSNPYCRLNG